jgi:hypothetical protein
VCCLTLCHVGFLSSPPSSSQIETVANKQGGIRAESINGTDSTGDSIISDALSSVGGSCAKGRGFIE